VLSREYAHRDNYSNFYDEIARGGTLGLKNLAMREDYARVEYAGSFIDVRPTEYYTSQSDRYSDVEEIRIKAANYIHVFMRLFKSASAEKINCRETRWKYAAITMYTV